MGKKSEDVEIPIGFGDLLAEFGYSLPPAISKDKTQLSLTLAEKKEWNQIVNRPIFRKVLAVTNQMKPSVHGNREAVEIVNQLAGWESNQFVFLTAGVVTRKKKKKEPKQEYQEPE